MAIDRALDAASRRMAAGVTASQAGAARLRGAISSTASCHNRASQGAGSRHPPACLLVLHPAWRDPAGDPPTKIRGVPALSPTWLQEEAEFVEHVRDMVGTPAECDG